MHVVTPLKFGGMTGGIIKARRGESNTILKAEIKTSV